MHVDLHPTQQLHSTLTMHERETYCLKCSAWNNRAMNLEMVDYKRGTTNTAGLCTAIQMWNIKYPAIYTDTITHGTSATNSNARTKRTA